MALWRNRINKSITHVSFWVWLYWISNIQLFQLTTVNKVSIFIVCKSIHTQYSFIWQAKAQFIAKEIYCFFNHFAPSHCVLAWQSRANFARCTVCTVQSFCKILQICKLVQLCKEFWQNFANLAKVCKVVPILQACQLCKQKSLQDRQILQLCARLQTKSQRRATKPACQGPTRGAEICTILLIKKGCDFLQLSEFLNFKF